MVPLSTQPINRQTQLNSKNKTKQKNKKFHYSHVIGADFHVSSPQPEKPAYTAKPQMRAIVHRVMRQLIYCLLSQYQIFTAWWQRDIGVNNMPKVITYYVAVP